MPVQNTGAAGCGTGRAVRQYRALAYAPGTGPATVRLEKEEDPLCVVITLIDGGEPFDPLAKEMPETTHLKARERPIGELGLFMMKKPMDGLAYEYRDGKNILTIRKKIC